MYRVRLQEISSRGRVRYFMYLPQEIVKAFGWVKGEELVIKKVVIKIVSDKLVGEELDGIIVYSGREEERIHGLMEND